MNLYQKISSTIKESAPAVWVYLKSVLSIIRNFLKSYDFPVAYYPSLNTIYLQVPKTATSTTLAVFLKKLKIPFDTDNYHSIHIQSAQFSIKKSTLCSLQRNNDIFIFAIVRNPYTRLISCYKDKIKSEKDSDILNDYFGIFTTSMSFEEFVHAVCKIPNFWANTHFKSQTSFVFFEGIKAPDFIGKFENYSRDIKVLQEKFTLPDVTESFNVTGKEYDLSLWYPPELQNKVYKKYKKDFEAFGYSKHLN